MGTGEDQSTVAYACNLILLLLSVPCLWTLAKCAVNGVDHQAIEFLLVLAGRARLHLARARWLWRPLSCGAGVSLVTGLMVHWDSLEPGVNPRSPVSPRKTGSDGGCGCHLAYLVAMVNGLATAALLMLVDLP